MMDNLEYVIRDDFQVYKAGGILISLLLIALFQSLLPSRLVFRQLLNNWKVNCSVAAINTFLTSLLCGACVCTWAVTVRESGIGFFEVARFPYWSEVAMTIVLLDFVAWIWHRANHQSSFLWRFHAAHHSDAVFDASTAFRFHPGEILISIGVRLLVVTLTGLPVLGLVAFEVVFGFFNLFVHSDIRIPSRLEGWIGLLFVTPSLHRLHHSILETEHNRNYGTIFACWDRLWSTYVYASTESEIVVGLPGQRPRPLRLKEILALPLKLDR